LKSLKRQRGEVMDVEYDDSSDEEKKDLSKVKDKFREVT